MRPLSFLIDNASMLNIYLDNPTRLDKWRQSLTREDRLLVDQGYLMAVGDLIDQLRKSKIKLLNKLQELKDEEETSSDEEVKQKMNMLLSRVQILDKYDDHYTQKIELLGQKIKEPELLTSIEDQ